MARAKAPPLTRPRSRSGYSGAICAPARLPPCHAPSRACAALPRRHCSRLLPLRKRKRPCTSCRGPIPRVDAWAFPRGVYANVNCLRTTAGVYHAVYQPQAIAVLAKRCRPHRLISRRISSSPPSSPCLKSSPVALDRPRRGQFRGVQLLY